MKRTKENKPNMGKVLGSMPSSSDMVGGRSWDVGLGRQLNRCRCDGFETERRRVTDGGKVAN